MAQAQQKQQASMQDTPIIVSDTVKSRSVSFAEQVVPIPATEKAAKGTAVAAPEPMYVQGIVMPLVEKETLGDLSGLHSFMLGEKGIIQQSLLLESRLVVFVLCCRLLSFLTQRLSAKNWLLRGAGCSYIHF